MNYKIGAVYNSFYGLSQIEKSIESIEDVVDEIFIIHQRTGFNGNEEPKYNEVVLNRLLEQGYEIVFYEQTNEPIQQQVLNKRNIGLELCRKSKLDIIIPLDCDERYDPEKLNKDLWDFMIKGFDTMYSRIRSFYYNETQFFKDTYFVPTAYRVNDRKFKQCKSSVLCDPVRKMEERKYFISENPMLHYSYMIKDYKEKIDSSILTLHNNNNQQLIYDSMLNWYKGKKALVQLNDLDNGGVNILKEIELIQK